MQQQMRAAVRQAQAVGQVAAAPKPQEARPARADQLRLLTVPPPTSTLAQVMPTARHATGGKPPQIRANAPAPIAVADG